MWHARDRRAYNLVVRKTEKRDHLEDRGVDGRTGSDWIGD
jgi:hypothetical protein